MYIEFNLNNLFIGDFSLGIHSQVGVDQEGKEFYEVCIGLLFFEISIGKNIN